MCNSDPETIILWTSVNLGSKLQNRRILELYQNDFYIAGQYCKHPEYSHFQ